MSSARRAIVVSIQLQRCRICKLKLGSIEPVKSGSLKRFFWSAIDHSMTYVYKLSRQRYEASQIDVSWKLFSRHKLVHF